MNMLLLDFVLLIMKITQHGERERKVVKRAFTNETWKERERKKNSFDLQVPFLKLA